MTSVGLRWEELLMPLLQKYKLNITWGDQDLLNIIFHYNPGMSAHTQTHTNVPTVYCICKKVQECPVCSNSIFLFYPLLCRVSAGVSVPVELSPGSLHLRQQLCLSRGWRHLHFAWKQRSLPRLQAAGFQGRLRSHKKGQHASVCRWITRVLLG